MNTVAYVGIGIVVIIFGVYGFSTMSKQAAVEGRMTFERELEESGLDPLVVESGESKGAMVFESAVAAPGSYEVYAPEKVARAAMGDVVIFFHASWCPTCRTVDADIKAHLDEIPEDLSILNINYDTSDELKKKYGVTYQHTFVQVDAEGNLIHKWQGGSTLASVVEKIK